MNFSKVFNIVYYCIIFLLAIFVLHWMSSKVFLLIYLTVIIFNIFLFAASSYWGRNSNITALQGCLPQQKWDEKMESVEDIDRHIEWSPGTLSSIWRFSPLSLQVHTIKLCRQLSKYFSETAVLETQILMWALIQTGGDQRLTSHNSNPLWRNLAGNFSSVLEEQTLVTKNLTWWKISRLTCSPELLTQVNADFWLVDINEYLLLIGWLGHHTVVMWLDEGTVPTNCTYPMTG